APLRRLRAGVGDRARPVGTAGRGAGRAGALRVGAAVRVARGLAVLLLAGLLIAPATHAEAGGRISQERAVEIADRDPNVVKEREDSPGLGSSASMVEGKWEVAYFAAGNEVALVIVDPHTGEVRESWTGYQVAWKMARGYSGAFAHRLDAPYVFLPLCAIFLVGLVDWRRLRRVANLDLLVLLGFG